MNGAADTIVLSRPDRLGDCIIATSAIRPLHAQLPAARIIFAARKAWLPVVREHPLLAGVIDADAPRDALAAQLRETGASAIVHMNPHDNLYGAAVDAGIPVRVGYAQSGSKHALTVALRDRRRRGEKHEAEYNFDLLAPLGIRPPARPLPEVHLPASALESLEHTLGFPLEQLQPFVVLNPTAFLLTARWPADHFLVLARRIRAETPWRIAIVGDKAGDDAARAVAQGLGDDALDLAGRTDVAELGWLLARSAGVVTRDTGTSHLAGAVGAPTVCICGRNEPVVGPTRWRALGPRVEVVTSRLHKRLLESHHRYWRRSFASVTPDAVYEALRRVADGP